MTTTPTEVPVLVVDDEQSIVNAIRRELNTPPLGRYRYAVEGFSDPQQALERARQRSFAAVISDYRMPQMTGLEFFKALYDIQPDCARIVLSGQTDLDSLVRMVNETHIYRFIPKPWSSYFLKSTLSQAVNYRQVIVRNRSMAEALRALGVTLPDETSAVDQILVVDDEIEVCHAVARDLTSRSHLDEIFAAMRAESSGARVAQLDKTRISVQTTTSPAQALRMADSIPFACVIADYKMHEMNGVELLQAFHEQRPDTALILLSGVAGMEEIISAVDLAHIHSYIAKPWNDYELRASVAHALSGRRLQIENKVLASMCRARNIDYVAE